MPIGVVKRKIPARFEFFTFLANPGGAQVEPVIRWHPVGISIRKEEYCFTFYGIFSGRKSDSVTGIINPCGGNSPALAQLIHPDDRDIMRPVLFCREIIAPVDGIKFAFGPRKRIADPATEPAQIFLQVKLQSILFFVTFVIIILAQIFITKKATGPHHAAMIAPLWLIPISVGLANLANLK
ncbi:MAG: hypothetical protein WCK38_04355, partial [Candidatus Omnitrophota bacterium]